MIPLLIAMWIMTCLLPNAALADPPRKDFSVSETRNINGTARTITAKVSYDDGNAAANAEAAKITGFVAGTNDTNNLVFTPTASSALADGATVRFVSVKTGADVAGAQGTDWGVSGLSMNTQKVVDGGVYSYVEAAFTVTLDGVTSDPVSMDITSLFDSSSTAAKLRTDKAKIPTNGSTLGNFTFSSTTALNTYYSLTPAVTLSGGVAFAPVVGSIIGGGAPGIDPFQLSLKAEVGGDVQIAFATMPNAVHFNCRWQENNIVFTCAGTSYTCTGVDFLVMVTPGPLP